MLFVKLRTSDVIARQAEFNTVETGVNMRDPAVQRRDYAPSAADDGDSRCNPSFYHRIGSRPVVNDRDGALVEIAVGLTRVL